MKVYSGKTPKIDLWAVQDERIAAVEAALGFLGSYTELGGSFLARRFRQEAWPQLQRLLLRGPDTPLNAPEPLAPAVIHRAQLAVVTYLQRYAVACPMWEQKYLLLSLASRSLASGTSPLSEVPWLTWRSHVLQIQGPCPRLDLPQTSHTVFACADILDMLRDHSQSISIRQLVQVR